MSALVRSTPKAARRRFVPTTESSHRSKKHAGRGTQSQSAFMPWICQGFGAEPGEPPPITDAPFKNHSTTCPLLLFHHRMSLLPSPLKSPVSATIQGLGTEPSE